MADIVDVNFRPQGEKTYNLHIEPRVHFGDGSIPGDRVNEPDLDLINPEIPWSWLKIREAEYFLSLLEDNLNHEAMTMCHMDGFVMALRSVTEILRKECKGKTGFEDWRQEALNRLKKNKDIAFFIDLRNRSLHQGARPPTIALQFIFSEDNKGDTTMTTEFTLYGAGGKKLRDGVEACHRALNTLRQVVEEAEAKGFLRNRKSPAGHVFSFWFRKQDSDGEWHVVPSSELASTSRLEGIGIEGTLRRIPAASRPGDAPEEPTS